MTEVLETPQNYGFQDATCSGDTYSNCIWWAPNSLHPTSHFHSILAKDMLPSLERLGY